MIHTGVQQRLLKLGWTLVGIQKGNGSFRPTLKTLWINPKYPDFEFTQKQALIKERQTSALPKS